MTHFAKTFALAAGLAAASLAGVASAATLSISGGMTVAVPHNYDPRPDVTIPDGAVTLFKSSRHGGSIGGGLMLDSRARVTYTFLGTEAVALNTLGELSMGETTLFSNRAAPGTSATVTDDGGMVDFLFRTTVMSTGNPAIVNGSMSEDKRLALVLSSVFNEGRSVLAAFGDGRGDNDHDDLVVQIDVAPVPIPAAGLLLVGAIGALGALRRRLA